MEDLVPTEFRLSQNYPDPFRERTTIKYCLPKKTEVKLELFDSAKRKVKTLVDEIKEEGTYKVELDGKDLDEGSYYCIMQAGSFTDTKKMILIRKKQ